MSGLDDPFPVSDWDSFRAARDRFFARVRPEAMDEPPASICPDAPPDRWPEESGHEPAPEASGD